MKKLLKITQDINSLATFQNVASRAEGMLLRALCMTGLNLGGL